MKLTDEMIARRNDLTRAVEQLSEVWGAERTLEQLKQEIGRIKLEIRLFERERREQEQEQEERDGAHD